jgi:hypothetical protein
MTSFVNVLEKCLLITKINLSFGEEFFAANLTDEIFPVLLKEKGRLINK